EQGADDVTVDLFEGFHLGVRPAFVRGFIGSLDVDAHQVVRSQGLYARSALGGVIRVEIAGRPRHVDAGPAEQDADAPDQVHGTYDGAALAIDLGKRPQLRGASLAPEPDLRGRPFAAGLTGLIHRVPRQDFPAPLHQTA